MNSQLLSAIRKISTFFGIIFLLCTNSYGMMAPTQKNIPLFISIPLAHAEGKMGQGSFPTQVKEKYFTQFDHSTPLLKHFFQDGRPHITLFTGRAYPVTCVHNICTVNDHLHDEHDADMLREEIGDLFKDSTKDFDLEISPELDWWKTKTENDGTDDFHKSYLVLKLAPDTQELISLFHKNFFTILKTKLGDHVIKGGDVSGTEYGFYLQSDVATQKITHVRKDESAVICLAGTTHCYLITTNEYYRTPVDQATNMPLTTHHNDYHITLSDSDKYGKIPLHPSGAEYFDTQGLMWDIGSYKLLVNNPKVFSNLNAWGCTAGEEPKFNTLIGKIEGKIKSNTPQEVCGKIQKLKTLHDTCTGKKFDKTPLGYWESSPEGGRLCTNPENYTFESPSSWPRPWHKPSSGNSKKLLLKNDEWENIGAEVKAWNMTKAPKGPIVIPFVPSMISATEQ